MKDKRDGLDTALKETKRALRELRHTVYAWAIALDVPLPSKGEKGNDKQRAGTQ